MAKFQFKKSKKQLPVERLILKTTYLPPSIIEHLERRAQKQGKTINETIREIIERFYEPNTEA